MNHDAGHDGLSAVLSFAAIVAALVSLGLAGYVAYRSAEANVALEQIQIRQEAIVEAQERLDRSVAEQIAAIHQSSASEIAARSALAADLSRRIAVLRERLDADPADAVARREGPREPAPDPFAHIPPHDEPEWYVELRSIRDADLSRLRNEAHRWRQQAAEHLRRAEQARGRGERFEAQRLERLGYDARREARRLEAELESPDLIVEGVDFLGRTVVVHLDRRWRARMMSRTPGDLIGFRGRPAVNSIDRLEIVDASLLRDVRAAGG